MVRSYKYYKLWCSTENKWVYNWFLTSNPPDSIECPNDKTHTLDTTLNTVLNSTINDNQNGYELKNNITNIPLGVSGTWTGSFDDVLDYSQVSFMLYSDTPGTLYVDMSIDCTSIERTITYPVKANKTEFHSFAILSRYLRLRFINGSIPQTQFHTYMIGHISKANNLTSKSNDIISNNNDVQLVRITNNSELDLSQNYHLNQKIIRIHASNPDVSTTLEDIWDMGGYYPWLSGITASTYLQVTSNNIQDGISGLGARKIRVYGLDNNYDELSEDIVLVGNGTAYSTRPFRRVYESHVIETGTFHGSNFNNIDVGISGSSPLVVLSRITGDGGTINTSDYGVGTSQQSTYTIPRNKTGYITRIEVIVDSNKTASVFLYKTSGIDKTPHCPRELLWRIDGFTGQYTATMKSYIKLEEKTDIWFRSNASASSVISVDYDLYLVDNV